MKRGKGYPPITIIILRVGRGLGPATATAVAEGLLPPPLASLVQLTVCLASRQLAGPQSVGGGAGGRRQEECTAAGRLSAAEVRQKRIAPPLRTPPSRPHLPQHPLWSMPEGEEKATITSLKPQQLISRAITLHPAEEAEASSGGGGAKARPAAQQLSKWTPFLRHPASAATPLLALSATITPTDLAAAEGEVGGEEEEGRHHFPTIPHSLKSFPAKARSAPASTSSRNANLPLTTSLTNLFMICKCGSRPRCLALLPR